MKFMWLAFAAIDLIIAGTVAGEGDHWNTAGYLLCGVGFLCWSMR